MTKYVAMIRGVGPENPNMRGEKLKWAFEQMGHKNVRSFLTSGNVLFESEISDSAKLEKLCEASLPQLLDFSRDVFVRSQADLQALVDANPFAGLVHENAGKTYLTVTFFKTPPSGRHPNSDTRMSGRQSRQSGIRHFDNSSIDAFTLPYKPAGKSFELIANVNGALCCVVNLNTGKTPELMQWLERTYGKHITTRTWNTVRRLLTKLNTH